MNEYLREISGGNFSSDFRTWAATVRAADALQEMEQVDSPSPDPFDSVASARGNWVGNYTFAGGLPHSFSPANLLL
ncbi:MAG: hypothetical protein M3072_15355 [Candidatus Dormibacteraeota bacterium]|nr:hypothetical protein [Candidatus Dormibacteraeota bacterium]